jgi:hypothetical protein
MSTPNLPTLSAKERNENPTMARALDVLRDYFGTVGRQGGLVTSRGLSQAVNDAIQDPSGWVILPLTGFAAVGAFRTIIVTYDDYGAHSSFAYVEIWRATVDDLGQAVKVGTSIAPVYVDSPPNASRAVTYYYWGRIVNRGGTPGPFNATAGTAATTADDPTYMLELLTGEIKASHLYTDLNTRIDLIDGPESMVNSVAYRVAQEAIARAQAILDEHDAWTAAVSSEAGTRQTADENEAYARETLASQMRGTYEGTDLTQVTSGLVYQERIARTSGDDALAQQISRLYAGVGGGFDPYTTWYFDASADGWTGTDCTIAQSSGWVEQTAVSAAPCYVEKTGLSVQGSKYGTVKFRIKRLAGSGWGISVDYQYGGNWYTGKSATEQTVAVGDTTTVTLDFSDTAAWTGNTITGLRVKTSATTADRFSFDWIAIGREGPAASVAALEAEQSARATADSAEVTARETLATQLRGGYTGTDVTQLTAGLIYSERQARSTADSEEVTARQALSAKLTGFNDPTGKSLSDLTSGLIYEEKSARVTAVGAVASDVSTLSTTVGGHTTSIQSLTTTTDGLNAQYTLKIDNNGFLSGWGLASESVSGTPFSQFIFQADRFSIINPNVTPATVTITRSGDVATVTHASHGKATGDYVVIAGADQREYNGTKQITVVNASTYTYQVSGSPATPATGAVKAGKAVVPFIVDNGVVCMDTLLVKNGAIKSAQIESLAADKLYTPSGTLAEAIIGEGHITDAMIGSVIQSTSYVPGSSGWYINKNGTVEFHGGTFRGAVTFTSPSSGYGQLTDRPTSLASINAVEGNMLAGASSIAFADYFKADVGWTNYSGAGERSIVAVTDGVGGSALSIGNNSGDDMAWLIHNANIPFDPKKLYRIRARARRTQGTGVIYIGVAGVAADGVTFVNINGDAVWASQHYLAASSVNPPTTWAEYTGFFKGVASTGTTYARPNITAPGVLHTNCRFFRPLILANYNQVSGITEIDYIIIEAISDTRDLGYTGDLAATAGAPAGTYVGSTLAQTVESNAASGANAWAKFSGAGNTLPAGNVEFNFAASSTKGGNATNTDNVGTQSATTVQAATINFNSRNDRNATAVVAPVVANATGTIDHTQNTDGSVDVSFEWTWGGNEADIDGFIVYDHDNGTTTPTSQKILAATADASVQVFYLTPQRRAFILYGVAANHWYTFGVQAYRIVDQDVDATGSKKSAIVQPLSTATETTYGAYRPSANVAFAGDITGTIAGTAASTVVSNAARTADWVKPGQTTIDGNKIYTGDAYVDTLQIKGNAVTLPVLVSGGALTVAFPELYTSVPMFVTKPLNIPLSVTVPSSAAFGCILSFYLECDSPAFSSNVAYSQGPHYVEITRNGTVLTTKLATVSQVFDNPDGSWVLTGVRVSMQCQIYDSPGPGTHTYDMNFKFGYLGQSTPYVSFNLEVRDRSILLLGTKR